MAYYSALQAAWAASSASPGALPNGVAGTSLYGLTTAQKIAAVNAWTVTGTIPTSFYVTGAQILNCVNWTEFAALTAQQQSNLLALCNVQGQLLGGSGNTAFLPTGMVLAYFTNHSGPTVTALTALANAQVQPWYTVTVANGGGGLNGPINQTDVTLAGLS